MHLKKISSIFKKKKELLANGYKNSSLPTVIILAISTVKCRNGCQVNK